MNPIEIQITDKEIKHVPSTKHQRRKVRTLLFSIVYILGGIAIYFADFDSQNQNFCFIILNLSALAFIFIFPKPEPLTLITFLGNKIKIRPPLFLMKSKFELNKIHEVKVASQENELNLVYIYYGDTLYRHDVVELLSEEDAQKIKSWIESKMASSQN